MQILNVNIEKITKAEAIKALVERQIIFTPNPEIILEAKTNKTFRKSLRKGTLMLPDGNGLLFVATMMKFPRSFRYLLFLPMLILFLIWKWPFKRVLPETIHGSDFMDSVIAHSVKNAKPVFFLGAKDGVAQKTAGFFKNKYPKLKIAGYSAMDPSYEAFEFVKWSDAKVLFVAYGAPKQEMWIAKYESKLEDIDIIMGVGGSFDFWGGEIKRAPKVMRRLGLEWLWRLILDPKKRLKRIWDALVVFPLTSFSSSSS